MQNEHVYFRNLVDVYLEAADCYINEMCYQSAVNRLEHAIHEIKQLIKVIKQEENDHPD